MLPLFVFKEENSILVAAMVIYKYNFELENSIVLRFYSHQPNGVMSSAVSLPNCTFTRQALSSKLLIRIVHILSPETDTCLS